MFTICEICEKVFTRDAVRIRCSDHLAMTFHLSCYNAREFLTGFGCPKCEAEEKESEE